MYSLFFLLIGNHLFNVYVINLDVHDFKEKEKLKQKEWHEKRLVFDNFNNYVIKSSKTYILRVSVISLKISERFHKV